MAEKSEVISIIEQEFKESLLAVQKTADDFPTLWFAADDIINIIDFLKNKIDRPYKMLYDLTAIDEVGS